MSKFWNGSNCDYFGVLNSEPRVGTVNMHWPALRITAFAIDHQIKILPKFLNNRPIEGDKMSRPKRNARLYNV